jgi:hypothetical protein
MSELIKIITPFTRGILWFVKDSIDSQSKIYEEVDYLLDGLLTANLGITTADQSRVIVGNNFNNSIYVFIVNETKSSEIQSFISLVQKDLGPENDILVIDEASQFEKLKQEFKEISAHLKFYS